MTQYRKKPVVVEAFQWMPDFSAGSVPAWFFDACAARQMVPEFDGTLRIETLNGFVIAEEGEFIIKGVQGEYYPCKSEIFEATYELA